MSICAVVLAGGSGTRLWPLSRAAHPKQFLSLYDEQTMLQATIKRLSGLDIHSSWPDTLHSVFHSSSLVTEMAAHWSNPEHG